MRSFNPTDYVFTPKDLYKGLRGLRGRHWLGVVASVFVGAGLVIGMRASAESAVFASILVLTVVARADPRWLFGGAILCLVGIMIMTGFRQTFGAAGESAVDAVAVWAFYFMAIGTLALLIESIWPNKGASKQQKKSTSPNRVAPQPLRTKPIQHEAHGSYIGALHSSRAQPAHSVQMTRPAQRRVQTIQDIAPRRSVSPATPRPSRPVRSLDGFTVRPKGNVSK